LLSVFFVSVLVSVFDFDESESVFEESPESLFDESPEEPPDESPDELLFDA
jgi:hypothetical protein